MTFGHTRLLVSVGRHPWLSAWRLCLVARAASGETVAPARGAEAVRPTCRTGAMDMRVRPVELQRGAITCVRRAVVIDHYVCMRALHFRIARAAGRCLSTQRPDRRPSPPAVRSLIRLL